MYATVYSEMKPHPTRRAEGGSGSGAVPAAVRVFSPRRAITGHAAIPADRRARDGMMILKGMMILSHAPVTRTPQLPA
jgi:hypothetical protein